MSIDSILNWPCAVKTTLESHKGASGVVQLVERLKMRHRLAMLQELAAEQGLPENQVAMTLPVDETVGRETTRQITLPEVRSEANVLSALESHCPTCPAAINDTPFSCVQFVHYPILQKTEQWLLDRMQPPESPGGFLLLLAFQDFNYDGEPIREYREKGLFASPTPLRKDLPANRFQRAEITTDQLFHPLFGVDLELDASHLMMVLLWFGMITLEGQVPTTREQASAVMSLTPAQRKQRTQLHLGPEASLAAAGDLPNWFRLMFRAWQLDQPALVDS